MPNKGPLLLKELVFEKADAEKDEINSRKRPSVTETFVPHCILPRVVSAAINRGNYLMVFKMLIASNMLGDIIKVNDFNPSYFYQTSIKTFSNEKINMRTVMILKKN